MFGNAEKLYWNGVQASKVYLGTNRVYLFSEPVPDVSPEDMAGNSTVDSYEEGSTDWGDLTLSDGVAVSEDGLEIQGGQTYASAADDSITYPMTLEFKGRVDSYDSSNPPMLWGMGITVDTWGAGCVCSYAHSNYGVIVDSNGSSRRIITQKTPEYVHAVFRIDAQGIPVLFLNGFDHSWTFAADNATRGPKTYFYNGEGKGRFVGAISVMRWWGVALTNAEVRELFANDGEQYMFPEDRAPEFPDTPAYSATGLSFDGATYVDTGVQLFGAQKSWMVEMEFTTVGHTYSSSNIGTVFHCMNEASPYPGVVFDSNSQTMYRVTVGNTSTKLNSLPHSDVGTHTLRLIYDVDRSTLKIKLDEEGAVSVSFAWVQVSQTMLLGAYQTTNGTKGRYWHGSIDSIEVYVSE